MSVQFGRFHLKGDLVAPDRIETIDSTLAPYGPDGANCLNRDGVSIVYRALHTTEEARRESQPFVSPSGAIIVWDGRLDNRAELRLLVDVKPPCDAPDVAIVAAAYEQWGLKCFERLVGDWALALCRPDERFVILAKDFAGTRPLYYSFGQDQIRWSSVLDLLALCPGRPHAICEEYLAGWLGHFPAAHLTPYVGIHSVPPSCFVRFQPGICTTQKYWDFDSTLDIRYRSDREYEEHFRSAFREAVSRRLRADRTVVAELSGGMDSSAIVCMADAITAQQHVPPVETLSYYDDSEPNWNERPYFSKIEEKRGRAGHHVDIGARGPFNFEFETGRFAATPVAGNADLAANWMAARGARVVLSGVGGDEVMGGVPTPLPEIADCLAQLRIKALVRSLKLWALNKRKPWFHLLFQAAIQFFPASLFPVPERRRPPAWLTAAFANRNRRALMGYPRRFSFLGPSPSFQENLATLDALRRQLGCLPLNACWIHERRYPYLDRDLLAFLYAIPREQLVRPAQRRSLMRRALTGIVPPEILERRRKGFVSRSPRTSLAGQWTVLVELIRGEAARSGWFLNAEALFGAMRSAREGRDVPIVSLMRTLAIQAWLKSIQDLPVRLPVSAADWQTGSSRK